MSLTVSFSQTSKTQSSHSVLHGPMNFLCSSMMTSIETNQAKVLCELQVLPVSTLNGRHLWARRLSGWSLGTQRVLHLTAGTDAPLSASKGPVGCAPSPFIVGAMVRFLFQKCVTNRSPVSQLLLTTAPAEQLLPFPPSSALPTAVHWGFCSVQISRGQLMSSPWPSHPNYGFLRKHYVFLQEPASFAW